MSIKGYINPNKHKQPDGVGYTVMQRTIRDEDGVEWVEYYNDKTKQWELQYYITKEDEEESYINNLTVSSYLNKQKKCIRGVWCYKCEFFTIEDKVGYCNISIPCKSFVYKGEK